MSKKLTIKQEKFVLKYFECGNGAESYRYAYSTKNMKDEVIWVKASKLIKMDKVRVRLNELRAKAEKDSQWNVSKVLKTYERVINIGLGDEASSHIVTEGAGEGISTTLEVEMRDTNLTAVNTALNSIAKHLGMFDRTIKIEGEFNLKNILEEINND